MTLTSVLNSRKYCVWSISQILFEVGIPNLVCGYTLGLWSVAYCLWVTVTLTSGLNFRKSCLWGHLSHCDTFLVILFCLACIYNPVMCTFVFSQGCNMGLDARKPVLGGCANNKGADQLAHPRSLISAFNCYSLVGMYPIYACYKQNYYFLASHCS